MKILKGSFMPAIAITLAVFLAFGSTAFKADKPLANTTMYYHGAAFDQSSVENKTNWTKASTACAAGSDKACQVAVPSGDVSSGGTFVAAISLVASSSSTSAILLDVKKSGTTEHPTIQNRQN